MLRKISGIIITVIVLATTSCGVEETYQTYKTYKANKTPELTAEEEENFKTVSEIAYDVEERSGYTVYIKENEEFVPYLVLTSDYDGDTLLVRKYILDELMPYTRNDSGLWGSSDFGGYYDNCTLDTFLSTEFIEQLSDATKELIVTKDIIITDRDTYFSDGDVKSMTIPRDVFILSLKEVLEKEYTTNLPEGDTLQYFLDDFDRQLFCYSNGKTGTYWTRTAKLYASTNQVMVIGYGGAITYAPAHNLLGVRPIFCIDGSTELLRRTDIVDGETVYTLE